MRLHCKLDQAQHDNLNTNKGYRCSILVTRSQTYDCRHALMAELRGTLFERHC